MAVTPGGGGASQAQGPGPGLCLRWAWALARDRKEVSGRPKACVEGHEKEKVHVRGDGCDGARVKCWRLSGSSGLLRNLALWGTSFPPMS